MGLLNALLGKLSGQYAANPGGEAPMPSLLQGMFGQLLGERGEQIRDLIDKLKTSGAGDAVKSWIGKGPNLPVSADQIRSALGSEKLQAMATQFGVSPEKIAELISKYLPDTVDQMTPDGEVLG